MKQPLLGVSYKKAIRRIKKSKRKAFVSESKKMAESISTNTGIKQTIYTLTFNIGKDLIK